MPTGPAARLTDTVAHPLPGHLLPGLGSMNVLIGFLKAWRGILAAAAAALQSAKQASDAVIQGLEATTAASTGPALPAAKAAEEAGKTSALATMGSAIMSAAAGADIHICATLLPLPPHGPGVVIDGSKTVLINFLPACRQGDHVLEALGPLDPIVLGCQTVIIGG